MINVAYCGEHKDNFLDIVKKANETGRVLVLDCEDADVAAEALAVCAANKPILNGANASNYEAMSKVATDAGVVLGVSGKDLNELYDTVAALEKSGNKNLVLDVTGASVKKHLEMQFRFVVHL